MSKLSIRRVLKVFGALVLVLVVQIQLLKAADAPTVTSVTSPSIDWADIATKLAAYFQPIQSVDIKFETGNPDHPNRTLHWMEKDNKVLYDWMQANPYMAQAGGYDGQHYQQFDPRVGVLYLSKEPFTTRMMFFRNETYFTTPFEWVSPRNLQNKDQAIKIGDIQSPKFFSNILKSASDIVQTTKDSHAVIQFTMPGGVDWFFKKPYNYRVYLAADQNFYPLGWEKIGSDGKVMAQYHVTELGKIKINDQDILYPKSISESYYNPDDNFDASNWGRPNIRVTDLSINSLTDGDFTVDPSKAQRIYDCDTRKLMNVPQ